MVREVMLPSLLVKAVDATSRHNYHLCHDPLHMLFDCPQLKQCLANPTATHAIQAALHRCGSASGTRAIRAIMSASSVEEDLGDIEALAAAIDFNAASVASTDSANDADAHSATTDFR